MLKTGVPGRVVLVLLALMIMPSCVLAGSWATAGGGYARTSTVDEDFVTTMYKRWEHGTGSTSFSQPVCDSSRLYLGTDDGTMLALDTKTGEQCWVFETDPRSRIRLVPTVESGVLYFGTAGGQFYAVEVETGRLRWKGEVKSWVTGSPVVRGGVVFLSCYDGEISALSPGGQVLWRHSAGGEFINTPLALAGDLVVYGTMSGSVVAVDSASGAQRWLQATAGWVSGLALDTATGALVVSSVGPRAGGIYRLSTEKGEVVWRYSSKDNNYWSAPAISSGSVRAGNLGSLVSLGLEAGVLEWAMDVEPATLMVSGKKRVFYPAVRTPVVARSGIYAVSTFEVPSPAKMHCVSLDGEVRSSFVLPDAPCAAPVYADGSLYMVTTRGAVQAWSAVRVMLGQRRIDFGDVQPVMEGGSTLVPVRRFAEECGASVLWDPALRTVTLSRGDIKISIPVGSNQVSVNGAIQAIPAPARIIADRTYVPLRFLAEVLIGARVSWDAATLTATISTP